MRVAATICAATMMIAAAASAGTTSLLPHLQTVTPRHGVLTLTYAVGDLTPLQVQVASSAATVSTGAFVPGHVKLQARLGPARSDPDRWRTPRALPPGTYYVHVSAMLSDGVTSCAHLSNCLVRWSNVVRVRVPR